MDNPPKIPSGYADRTLRIIMIVAFFPASILLTACGFVYQFVPTIGLLPMAMSLAINIAALKNPKSPVRKSPLADAIVALFLLAVLIYSWVVLLSEGNNELAAMLSAFGMSPMIVNFCIHAYIVLRTILPRPFEPTPCPNCNHTPSSILPRWHQGRHVALPADDEIGHNRVGPQVQIVSGGGPGRSRSIREIYQPPPFSPRGQGVEDANPRESSEFQTSGFNTPRQSAETLRSDVRDSSEDSGETVRRDGKGGSLV